MKNALLFLSVLLIAATVTAQSSWTVRDNRTGRTCTVTENITRSYTIERHGSGPAGVYYTITLTGTGWMLPVDLERTDSGELIPFNNRELYTTIFDRVPYRLVDAVGNTLKWSLTPPRLTAR